MASLYLYKFNNYYNRKYKVYDTLAEYGDVSFTETGTNFNFNPNDGVTTAIVLGRAGNPYNGNCDYAIYCEDNVNITSRWFIIEQPRNRQGQYTLTLRRDVLADNPSWLQAPTFIEKCTLNKYSPFIYNSEDFSVNEIKTSQTPIYDRTKCPWIVGFYASNLDMGKREISTEAYFDVTLSQPIDEWVSDVSNYKYVKYVDYMYLYKQGFGTHNGIGIKGNVTHKNSDLGPSFSSNLWNNHPYPPKFDATKFNQDKFDNRFNSSYADKYKSDYEATFSLYNDKIVKDSNGNYYKVTLTEKVGGTGFEYPVQNSNMSALFDSLVKYTGLDFEAGGTSGITGTYLCRVSWKGLNINYVKVPSTSSIYTFGITGKFYDLDDAPYRMFCMPLGEIYERYYVEASGPTTVKSNPHLNLQIASLLCSEKYNTGENAFTLLDCQIVPYCPLPDSVIGIYNGVNNPAIQVSETTNPGMAHAIKSGETVVGYMYSCPTSSYSREVYPKDAFSIEYDTVTLSATESLPDIKTANQTEKYRLCAGNYTAAFDFNVAKNIDLYKFNAYFTYKPFNSYIRVAPIFKNLYGGNFKDSRGLVCSGLSLAKSNDAFNQYRLQNKYYSEVFDRQIQNIEVQNKYQRIQQAIGAGVSALGTGVNTGLVTGNVGAGIGAGAASAVGGIADYRITEALQNEALSYTKDNFGYQLQTIKAQVDTLSRTSDYNVDSQYVPFLEYYTCTNDEVKAFINKMRYNGMTAMFIDKPENVVQNSYSFRDKQNNFYDDLGYFKGVPIRLDDVSDDYHMARTIAEELNKGVYMK